MKLPITRRVEKALVDDYLPKVLGIEMLNIYAGHEAHDVIEYPNLIVYGEGSTPHPGMPAEVGARVVKIRCRFQVDTELNERWELDAWRELLESKLVLEPALMNSILNAEDSLIQDLYFHEIELEDDPCDRVQTDWIEEQIFNVICEHLN